MLSGTGGGLMKSSSQPLQAQLVASTIFGQKLDRYAVAAYAAGVSLLALAQPAEAEIIYTPAHASIGFNANYNIDLNNDGVTDITLREAFGNTSSGRYNALSVAPVPEGNGVLGEFFINRNYASVVQRGGPIGSQQNFVGTDGALLAGYGTLALAGGFAFGKWVRISNQYLGVKFVIGGQTHYGWVRLTVQVQGFAIRTRLNGYAYETTPGKSIRAGATSGPAEGTAEEAEFVPDTDGLDNPVLSTSTPRTGFSFLHRGSLGALALGAQSMDLWRDEE
jgi:hypothetical protein